MWQRFTERARKVVFYAQEEAQKFGDGYVSTEHLLLGLIREEDGVAARVLAALSVEPGRVRGEVEKQLPAGDARPTSDMTLTPRAKRVIDLAYDEARRLNNNYIGTEHLLLGLVAEGDGLAGRVLKELGVELAAARRQVEVMQDQERRGASSVEAKTPSVTPPPDPWANFGDTVRRALDLAEDEAQRRGQTYLTTEHLLLGILAERESRAVLGLASLGVDVDRLGEETAARCRVAGPPREEDAFLSAASSKAFSMAYEEQRRFGDEKVGTEHLLLGIAREPDGVAGRVLDEFGVKPWELHEAIRLLGS